ncbi:RNA chaperone Hfq [Staphylococcus lugdunensis]|uniref:RNA chaperone Hfq n=1 Tax=Staphylococcus lugdunensis TaxID=28035 RepID=UPI001F4CE4B6|nr:RNA chaperone Hfq [Staphylococcus lugdunensis]MCH8643567.1 RNA chaperone Hfq [Staphylococcus lugdunensis]
MIANHNIQDQTLENFKVNQTEVTVFFLNGFQMKGVIEDFDKYVVNIVSQGKQHLIYKHAISTFDVDTEGSDTVETNSEE